MIYFTGLKPIRHILRDDPFYDEGDFWATLRFPLIKPYYATELDIDFGWDIDLYVDGKEMYWYSQIQDVEKIAVENGVIMVYTPYEGYHRENGNIVLYWFAIVPDQSIETGFITEAELIDYIQQFGIDKPVWRDPFDINHEFNSTWCLDWIPDCQ